MSGRDADELDELRKERLEELQDQQGGGGGEAQEEAQEQARQQAEAKKQAILRQYLTDGARQRLNSVRMSRPDFADQVEQQLVAVAQSGRLGDKIDENQMKELLREMAPDSKSFDIKHR
ncbi:MAG: DNA-binding protein [Halobacteriales archaeon]|nr:DNA-binding protein [Halobacteriales archaeon]